MENIIRNLKSLYIFFGVCLFTYSCSPPTNKVIEPVPNLTFEALTVEKNSLTTAQILEQIQGDKAGYTLKSLTLNDNSFGTVTGTKPNFIINLKKEGTFELSLVLEKAQAQDVTIIRASITYKPVERGSKLTFKALTVEKNSLTTAQILEQIQGDKAGYTLKSLTLNDNSFGTVTGTKPNFIINLKKEGTFELSLVLEKAQAQDVTIIRASITYKKKPGPISHFHQPGLFIIETDFNDLSVTGKIHFRKEDGTIVQSIYQHNNGKPLGRNMEVWMIKPHQNGFLIQLENSATQKAKFLLLNKEFKVQKEIPTEASNANANKSNDVGIIDNNKFYYTTISTKHLIGSGTDHVYILDLVTGKPTKT